MKKKLGAFLFLLFVCIKAYSQDKLENIFFLSDKVDLGQPFVAYAVDNNNYNASVSLINSKGQRIAKANGFKNLVSISQSVWVFIIGIDSTLIDDKYNLEFKIDKEITVRSITINRLNFFEERVELNSKMTSLKTEDSIEKTKDTKELTNLINTFNDDGRAFEGVFSEPLNTVFYTGEYGDRRIFVYPNGNNYSSVHYGLDYRAKVGTKLYAPANGVIMLAKNRRLTGNSIVLKAYPGVYLIFYHLDSLDVKQGDIVTKGSVIGLTGATGLVTGPHLHYEVRVSGVAVNPKFFLKRNILDKEMILNMINVKSAKQGMF